MLVRSEATYIFKTLSLPPLATLLPSGLQSTLKTYKCQFKYSYLLWSGANGDHKRQRATSILSLCNGVSQIKLFLASFWSTFIRSLNFPAKWKQRSVCARIHSTLITKRRGKCYQNIGILFSGLRCMMTDLLKFIWYAKFAGKSISK